MQNGRDTAERSVTALFENLDPPEVLAARAATGHAPAVRPRVNAHIHLPPNFSAFDSVAEAVQRAAVEGVAVLGASNYYDYEVYGEFAAEAEERGIFPLFGLEVIALVEELVHSRIKLNDPGNPGKMYLCGKGIGRFDPMPQEAADLLNVIRGKDSARIARMIDCLAALFRAAGLDTGLDENTVKEQVVRRHGSPWETVYLQERHVAQAFQEAVFEHVRPEARGALLELLFDAPSKAAPDDGAAVQSEIRSHLMKAGKRAYVEETFVGFDHAFALVLALGGIPCYPTLADGATPICEFETPVDSLIKNIQARGIHCAELIPVRNSPEQLTLYVTAMRQAGLIVTAGTEHNTRDMLPMEPTCIDGQPIPEPVLDIFWEGARVAAAHQYLVLRGETGFVDAAGRPNPAYATAEERISAFSSLGGAVILQYREKARSPALRRRNAADVNGVY